jgi:hypothetical protein
MNSASINEKKEKILFFSAQAIFFSKMYIKNEIK